MSDKTRAELLEMLAAAVRNTQPKPNRDAYSKRKRETKSCKTAQRTAETKKSPGHLKFPKRRRR